VCNFPEDYTQNSILLILFKIRGRYKMSEQKEKKNKEKKGIVIDSEYDDPDCKVEEDEEFNNEREQMLYENEIFDEICNILDDFREYTLGVSIPLGEYLTYSDMHNYLLNLN
jgi:hypothetical protein